jgi:hypothetical protein
MLTPKDAGDVRLSNGRKHKLNPWIRCPGPRLRKFGHDGGEFWLRTSLADPARDPESAPQRQFFRTVPLIHELLSN